MLCFPTTPWALSGWIASEEQKRNLWGQRLIRGDSKRNTQPELHSRNLQLPGPPTCRDMGVNCGRTCKYHPFVCEVCLMPLGICERICQPIHRASCPWNPLTPNVVQFYVAFSAAVLVGADLPFQALKVKKSPFVRSSSLFLIWKYTELVLLRGTHWWSLGLMPSWTWCPFVSLWDEWNSWVKIIHGQTQHNFCLLTCNHIIGQSEFESKPP